MNKAELVEEVANQTALTKKVSREGVDVIISAITDSLARNERVALVSFGNFQVMERKGRRGVSPQTRAATQIAARRMPKSAPAKDLRKKVGK